MNRGVEVVRSLSRNLCLISLRSVRNIMEVFDAIRKRKGRVSGENKAREEKRNVEKEKKPSKVDVYNVEAGTYWLTRIVFLRSLSFIYCKFYKFLVTIFYLFTMQFSPARFRNFDKGRSNVLFLTSFCVGISLNLSHSLRTSRQGVVAGGNFNTAPYLYHACIVEPKLYSYPLFIHLEWNKREPTNSCKGLLVPARSFGLARLMPCFLRKLLLCINPFRFRFMEGSIYSQL